MRQGRRHPGLMAFTPYGPSSASSRSRIRTWISLTGTDATLVDYAGLRNHGVGTLARHAPAVQRAERRVRALGRDRFERLFIHREVTPFSSGGLAEQLAGNSDHSVYDFDDALMWSDELADNARLGPSTLARRLWSKAQACQRAVTAVDTVLAGNEVLAEWASQYNSDVRLMPTCVDPDGYRQKIDYTIGAVPRLVWLGGPATEYNLQVVAPALLQVHARTGARLTVISAGEADLGPLTTMVDRVTWSLDEAAELSRYDIALAPLVDSIYERGKSAYKLLQYSTAGLPAVASPVAANRTVAAQLGQATADSVEEWVDTLVDLLGASPQERAWQGSQARAAVLAGYSFESWQDAWVDAVGLT